MKKSSSEPTDAMQKIARASCDPLWIQHRALATGHSQNTNNGTATFVRFGGRHYVCTCAHVVEAATGDDVPALMMDRVVLNIGRVQKDGVYRHNFRFPDRQNLDIAIAPLTAYHWGLLETKKSKVAINLDTWEAPGWPEDGSYAAVGYFNEHKNEMGSKLATPMGFVVAELASNVGPSQTSFALHSTLADPHGYYFSGMSGGPIFLIMAEDKIAPVGIVFEGGPSTGRSQDVHTLIGGQDIFIRGNVLTPGIFARWLFASGL